MFKISIISGGGGGGGEGRCIFFHIYFSHFLLNVVMEMFIDIELESYTFLIFVCYTFQCCWFEF